MGANVAIDNSNTFSRGRIYLSIPSPQNDVEVFDAAQRPVDFPATASYIIDNKLTGTPSGPFGSVLNTAVDSSGDLFVFDTGKNVVDEFDSSGTFLRTFPGGIPATDPTNGNVLIRSDYYHIAEYDSSGNLLETINDEGGGAPAVNSQGYLYSTSGNIYTPAPVVPNVTYKPVTSPTTTSGTLNANVDPNGGGNVTECKFEYGEEEGNYSTRRDPLLAGDALLRHRSRQRRALRPDHGNDLSLPSRGRRCQWGQVRRRSDLHSPARARPQHRRRQPKFPNPARSCTAPLSATAKTPATTSNGVPPPPTATKPRSRTPARHQGPTAPRSPST